MKLIISLALAYLATAIVYVWRDLAETHPPRRPLYVVAYRQTGKRSALVFAGAGWLPGALVNAFYKRRIDGREGVLAAIFVGLAILFLLV